MNMAQGPLCDAGVFNTIREVSKAYAGMMHISGLEAGTAFQYFLVEMWMDRARESDDMEVGTGSVAG